MHLGETATCLSNGIEITGTFSVTSGVATHGNLGVAEIGTVNIPYPATRLVSRWVRRSSYARSAQITNGTKTLRATDSTTWTTQEKVDGWTAPTGDSWHEAKCEVDSVYRGSSVTGRDHVDHRCTAVGSTPRVAQAHPTLEQVSGTGS